MLRVFFFLFLASTIYTQRCTGCVDGDQSGPVCGRDGRTYINSCFARCSKVRVWYEGRCAYHNCPQLYYPVCTASGRTYMNECEANFYEEQVVAPGPCGFIPYTNIADNVQSIQIVPSPVRIPYQWP